MSWKCPFDRLRANGRMPYEATTLMIYKQEFWGLFAMIQAIVNSLELYNELKNGTDFFLASGLFFNSL
jgi:hypothetical protein